MFSNQKPKFQEQLSEGFSWYSFILKKMYSVQCVGIFPYKAKEGF